MADVLRPDSGTGVLLSTKERREVLGRLGGGGLVEENRQKRRQGGFLLPVTGALRMGGGEGEGREGVDRWIVVTGVDPRIPPIPGLDHPNIMSYVDVLI